MIALDKESYVFDLGATREVARLSIVTSSVAHLSQILYHNPTDGWLNLEVSSLPIELPANDTTTLVFQKVEADKFEFLGFELSAIVSIVPNDYQETRLKTVEEVLDSITSAFQIDETQVFMPDRPLVIRKTVKAQEGHGQLTDFPSVETGYPNLRNGVLRFYCIDTVNYCEIESPDGIITSFKIYIPNFNASARLVLADTTDRAIVDKVDAATSYLVGGDQVVSARVTGWSQPTGTADRTGFDTETAATKDIARCLKALIDDLFTHGLIGS